MLEIFRHRFAVVEAFFDFGVGDVATNDYGAVERQACCHGELVEFGEDFAHGAVEVDFHSIAFACVAQLFGNQFAGVGVEFLNPKTLFVDFCFHVAVGRAAYAHADGAGCAVARQADYAYVVCEIFASELCTETDLLRCFFKLVFQLDVAECAAIFVACGRQVVVIFD